MSNEMEYETVYIFRPDLTDEMTKKANDKIAEIVQRYGGRLQPLKDMGKRALAYPIAKMSRGHYFQLNFFGTGKTVEELERHLKMSEDAIRYLTVQAVHFEPYQEPAHTEHSGHHGHGHGRSHGRHQQEQEVNS